jgi:hypothetical protein
MARCRLPKLLSLMWLPESGQDAALSETAGHIEMKRLAVSFVPGAPAFSARNSVIDSWDSSLSRDVAIRPW